MRRLEADVGAKRHAQIVVRTAGEVDFVGDIKTQTDWSKMSFEAAAGIEDADDIVVAEIANVAKEISEGSGAVAEMKIHEAAFELNEGVDMPVFAEVDLGPEFAMKDAHPGALDGNAARAV